MPGTSSATTVGRCWPPLGLGARTAPDSMVTGTLPMSFALGSVCNGCCVDFHSRPRLVWHLMHSPSPRALPPMLPFSRLALSHWLTISISKLLTTPLRALRRSGGYDRVAAIPSVRFPGCCLTAQRRCYGGGGR